MIGYGCKDWDPFHFPLRFPPRFLAPAIKRENGTRRSFSGFAFFLPPRNPPMQVFSPRCSGDRGGAEDREGLLVLRTYTFQ